MSDENTTPADTPAPEPPADHPAEPNTAAAPGEPAAALPDTAVHVALPEHGADQVPPPGAEPTPSPVAEAAPELAREPEPQPEPEPEPQPVSAPTEAVSEPAAESPAEPEPEAAPEPELVAFDEDKTTIAPPLASAPQFTAEAAPVPVPVADAETTPTAEAPEPVAEAEAQPAAEPPAKKKRASRKKAEEPTPAEEGTGEPTAEGEPAPAAEGGPVDTGKKWYVVKVQSGREESIKAAIERKIKIEGLEESFGQIAIPTEDVVEKKKVKAKVKDKKTGEVESVYQEKNVTKKRKKFPGYLFAEVDFNDRILYVFRETSGVGDFVGATHHRAPSPMNDREVRAMLTGIVEKADRPKTIIKLNFEKGDKVRIREGAFSGMEGEVKTLPDVKDATAENTKVTVVVSIFGRPVDVELDYWQVDKV